LIIDLVDLMEPGEKPTAPIFLDSPLAIRATEVFRKHAASLDPNIDVVRLLNSPHLRFTEAVEESKSIAKLSGFHIIIAASGMCDAGRIRHHLKHWLWNSRATVLLVGFQARGTLGRFLEGLRPSASRVRRSRWRRGSAGSTIIQDMRTDPN
jgi:metallo-beta-lactamase family protein